MIVGYKKIYIKKMSPSIDSIAPRTSVRIRQSGRTGDRGRDSDSFATDGTEAQCSMGDSGSTH